MKAVPYTPGHPKWPRTALASRSEDLTPRAITELNSLTVNSSLALSTSEMLRGCTVPSRAWAQAEGAAVLRSGAWVKEGLAGFFLQLRQICIQKCYLCNGTRQNMQYTRNTTVSSKCSPTSCTLKPPWHPVEAAQGTDRLHINRWESSSSSCLLYSQMIAGRQSNF